MMRQIQCSVLLLGLFVLTGCNRPSSDGLQPIGVRVHHPVSTNSAVAQAYFDEGLTLVYAFNRDQAITAFQHATQADPTLAIAYWGEALAEGPNINYPSSETRLATGRLALEQAQQPSMHASAVERALIAALVTRFEDFSSDQQRAVRYNEAMALVAQHFSDDDDVQTLAAESLLTRIGADYVYGTDHTPSPLTDRLLDELSRVLGRNPGHIGANHLWIHALDASGHPMLALRSARLLSSMQYEPAASHLAHMGSHVFMQLGDWQHVAFDNDRAVAQDEQLASALHVDPTTLDYYDHNLDFAIGAELMRGNFNAADAFFPSFRGNNQSAILEYLIFEKAWGVLRRFPPPLDPTEHIIWRYARVLADIAERRDQELPPEHAAFLSEFAQHGASDQNDLGVISDVERGSIAYAFGKRDAGAQAFRQALLIQQARLQDELPEWRFPIARQFNEARAGAR